MRRLTLLVFLIVGLGLALVSNYIHAQDGEQPEFIGSRLCLGCHRDVGQIHVESRHALTLTAGDQENAILGDLSQDADALTIAFPGEDDARALTADDIAYVIGTGRYVQRYLYEVPGDEDDDEDAGAEYMVLPVQWNAVESEWQTYALADEWPAPEYDWEDNCAACHVTGFSAETNTWLEDGVQCETCHGPGGDHLEAVRSRDLTPEEQRASIVLSPDSAICGQCHSVGTSADGHPFPVNHVAGESLLSEDAYTLSMPDDAAHWWPTGHASDKYMQFNEWLNSTHATSADGLRTSERAEDACLICHSVDYVWNQAEAAAIEAGEREGDAPEPVTVESAENGVTCVSCHTVHQTTEEGEASPDFLLSNAPYEMCTACHQDTDVTGVIHAPVKEMFEGESVIEGVDGVPSAHYTAEDGPRCTTCHMPRVPIENDQTRASHVFHPVMPGAALDVEALQDTCSACHADVVGAADLQRLIDDIQADTQRRLDAVQAAVTDEAPAWVSAGIRFVDGDGSLGVHNYVYTDEVLDLIEAELGLVSDDTADAAAEAGQNQ